MAVEIDAPTLCGGFMFAVCIALWGIYVGTQFLILIGGA